MRPRAQLASGLTSAVGSTKLVFETMNSISESEVEMQRIRLTIRHNPIDPADDLRYAARVRRDLWAHSPVEIDPDSPVHGTHRDVSGNAYFEIVTNYQDEVRRILHEYDYESRVSLSVESGKVSDGGEPAEGRAPVLSVRAPNVKALAVLSAIRKRREGKTQPGSGDARDYLREARSGGMYGYDPEDGSSMRGD
jgi:hypothetical protein